MCGLGAASLLGRGPEKESGGDRKPLSAVGPLCLGRRTRTHAPVLAASTAFKDQEGDPPTPAVWFLEPSRAECSLWEGPAGCVPAKGPGQGKRVEDAGGETEEETRLMCEAGPVLPHDLSPPGSGEAPPGRPGRLWETKGPQGPYFPPSAGDGLRGQEGGAPHPQLGALGVTVSSGGRKGLAELLTLAPASRLSTSVTRQLIRGLGATALY